MADHHHAATPPRPSRRKLLGLAALITAVPALTYGGFHAIDLWWSWRSLDREVFDTTAYDALPPVSGEDLLAGELGDLTPSGEDMAPVSLAAESVLSDVLTGMGAGTGDDPDDSDAAPAVGLDDRYDTYMVVGSDEGDHRADVIILVLLATDGSKPIMVSLPRDLYLPNRCTGGLTRLNANYNGCGPDLNGATQLAGAVEDFTGVTVDHFALFTMDGFERIIDAVGGMEICVDHPVREDTRLDLPAGCTQADGEMALGWVRSRKTQEYVDGRWRIMPGVDDLTRNQRQQDLILTVVAKAGQFDSPGDLTGFAASLSDAFTLDDRLSLSEAANLAWDHRHLSAGDLVRLTIPVEPYTTSAGAQVLLPTATFAAVVDQR